MRGHAKASSAGSKSGRRALRGTGLFAALLVSLVAGACALPSSALAVELRSVTEAFGPDGTSGTSFVFPSTLGFDQGSKRLYALDGGDEKIHAFDSSTPGTHTPLSGNFPLSVPVGEVNGIAADGSSHDFYYTDPSDNALHGFDASGSVLSGFPIGGQNYSCGTAVDSAGNVWVSEGNEGKVKKYSPAGALLNTYTIGGEPCHLAFDSEDNLYVGFYFGATKKYTASSTYTTSSTIDPEFTSAMTVDRSTGEVYVIHYNYIDVWSNSGEFLYELKGEGFGGEFAGIAIDEGTEELYVADYGHQKIQVYGPPIKLQKATTEGADGISGSSATLHGTVDPEEQTLTGCHFEFVPDAQFQVDKYESVTPAEEAPCVPAAGSIPADSSPHAVSASVSGLQAPAATYHFRLVASSALGSANGADRIFITAPGSPVVSAQSVEAVGTSDAIVSAKVNPHGAQTTYRVEYGTSASYGQSTPESEPIGFATDNSNHSVSVHITGLSPGTAYHFRFVATSTAGVAEGTDTSFATYPSLPSFGPCSNDFFRTGFGSRLADCRAYEQVTPADKNGANIQGTKNALQASSSGNRITFYLNGGLPTTGGSSRLAPFMASRSAAGWSTDGLLPPTAPGDAAFVVGWSEDLASTIVRGRGAGGVGSALSLRDSATAAFQVVASSPTGGLEASFAGSAADSSHLIFESQAQLLPGAPAHQYTLYELDHGTLFLPGRIPASGTSCDDAGGPACVPVSGSSHAGPYNWFFGGTCEFFGGPLNGGASCGYYTQTTNAISRDGSRIFFTDSDTSRLYVRESGTTTTQVSASQASAPDPNGQKPAAFMNATPDGSKVLFASCEKLTDDSTAVSTGESNCTTTSQGQDLYSYDTDTGDLTDLTVDTNVGDALGAAVQGVLGASDDGSYIYFVANGVLASGASSGGCRIGGGEGTCNLYLSHDGVTTLVAPVSGKFDQLDWSPGSATQNDSEKTSRVAADGTLLFASRSNLTGYDNTEATASACGGSNAGDPCAELYRYSPSGDELRCVSCNPTGARPSGEATLLTSHNFVHDGPTATILPRNLSSDGNRVFFESRDALLPTDTNGVSDVYEWEADGSGACHTAGGCTYLLSTGTSPDPSFFADASANGDHAFFFTSQQLVPGDHDQLVDIYDAGVGDGLASQHELAPPTCTGVACQANPPPPAEQGMSSATFSGPGNAHKPPAARKCPRGKRKVRRAGKVRCQKAHKQHKRHNNRGGSK